MTFKEKLIKLRKLKGLTQDEFASAIGVTRQSVYKWESGQSYPEVVKLLEIKLLFNISLDDLFDDNYEVVLPEKKKSRKVSQIKLSEKEKEEIENTVKEELRSVENDSEGTKAEEADILFSAESQVKDTVSNELDGTEDENTAQTVFSEKTMANSTAYAENAEKEEDGVNYTQPLRDNTVEEKTETAVHEKKKGFFGRLFNRKQ